MTAPYSAHEKRHRHDAQPEFPSWSALLNASDIPDEPRPLSRSAAAAGDDLWSAPSSVLPINSDLLEDELLASLGPMATSGAGRRGSASGTSPAGTQTDPDKHDPPPGPGAGRPRRRSTGLALFVAVLVLIGLGLLAQQLDAPAESDGPTNGSQPVTIRIDPLPSVSLRPIPRISSGVDTVTEGSPECPMRLRPDPQATQTASSGGLQCFFIG